MSAAEFIHSGKLFINGRYEDGASGKTFDVVNPATGEMLTTVPDGGCARCRPGGGGRARQLREEELARDGSVEEKRRSCGTSRKSC